MITFTNDQYEGLGKLDHWYRKLKHQFIDISGTIGTGTWDLVQYFCNRIGLDPREIMYLSYDQKQVLELAGRRYHAYYIDGIIYKYTRIVDFNSLPVVNPNSDGTLRYEWKKEPRKKIDEKYKLIVVFDSVLLDHKTLADIGSYGLPVILIRDPMLMPASETYTFMNEPDISLKEIHPDYIRNPIVYFAHKVLHGERLKYGSFDNVSVVPRKQMNMYNLRYSNMVLTISNDMMDRINTVYREKMLRSRAKRNVVGERVIVMNDLHAHRLVNKEESKIKVYLTKGLIGTISKCNAHAIYTKYVPIELKPEFYDEVFDDLVMDRHYLNGITAPSRQIIPDEVIKLKYAYALSVPYARLSHWDKLTVVVDHNEEIDPELQTRLLYAAIASARKSLTIIL